MGEWEEECWERCWCEGYSSERLVEWSLPLLSYIIVKCLHNCLVTARPFYEMRYPGQANEMDIIRYFITGLEQYHNCLRAISLLSGDISLLFHYYFIVSLVYFIVVW